MNRPPKRVLGALAIVTGCSLTFQVALTRTLAAMLAYHYGFLAISLSLLGIGAAGLYVYVRPAWFERRSLEGSLATWSLVYAVALTAVPIVVVRMHLEHPGHGRRVVRRCAAAPANRTRLQATVAARIEESGE